MQCIYVIITKKNTLTIIVESNVYVLILTFSYQLKLKGNWLKNRIIPYYFQELDNKKERITANLVHIEKYSV